MRKRRALDPVAATSCHRCKRHRPPYAKGLCRSCYALRLYYHRQGRPLPPYRVRVRTCRGCGQRMPCSIALYCHDGCRDRTAQRRRIRYAVRRLERWGPWFGHLRSRERAVLERRLAGETHHAIGQGYGWTRQYSQQVEQTALRTLRRASRMTKQALVGRGRPEVYCVAHGT